MILLFDIFIMRLQCVCACVHTTRYHIDFEWWNNNANWYTPLAFALAPSTVGINRVLFKLQQSPFLLCSVCVCKCDYIIFGSLELHCLLLASPPSQTCIHSLSINFWGNILTTNIIFRKPVVCNILRMKAIANLCCIQIKFSIVKFPILCFCVRVHVCVWPMIYRIDFSEPLIFSLYVLMRV